MTRRAAVVDKCSVRRCQVWHILCLALVLLGTNSDAKGKKGKIKRRQPDDQLLPTMVVFSLDHTLWPFAMEMMQQPLVAISDAHQHQIKDSAGRHFSLFPEVHDILEELDANWYKIGGLSDNSDIRVVEKTTDLFDIDKFMNVIEAKPGNKTEQLRRISERAKVPLENILYYDTNQVDLEDVKAMNVTTVLLHPNGGITYAHIERGFKVFRDEKESVNATTTTAAP